MTRLVLAIVLICFPSMALAQVPGDDTGTETPPPPPPPPPDSDPTPPPPPPVELAPAVEPDNEPTPGAVARPVRPEGNTIAIGLGWDLPAELQIPNITSVRFRHASGFTVEPQVELARAGSKLDTSVPPDVESTVTGFLFAVLARLSVISNGRVDLELAGGFAVELTNENPDMPDNDTATTTLAFSYGLALTYWFGPHLQLSLTGMNPIFSTTKEVAEMGPTIEITTTSSNVGLVFDPNVFVMFHLYL